MTFSIFNRSHPVDPTPSNVTIPLPSSNAHPFQPANRIRSTRHSPLTFLPKQLIAEFSKLANFYFLFISILQQVPGWSTTGQFSTLLPLVVFVTISILHEAYDDYKRYRSDRVENERTCKRLQGGGWSEIKWQDVAVGDVLELWSDEWVPADMVVLWTALEEGQCFVETADLDGETNLKSKSIADASLASLCRETHVLHQLQGRYLCGVIRVGMVHVEQPNRDLHAFHGYMQVNTQSHIPLSTKNLLLRGTKVKNTPKVHGIVVYAGEQSKIRMNALHDVPVKHPAIQRSMNHAVFTVVVLLILFSVALTIISVNWQMRSSDLRWYIPRFNKKDVPALFFSFVILLNTLIPISLYVTLEVVKVIQAWLISQDVDMYHAPTNTPAEARTTVINEDLGQVKWVFSDKTGTLTENVMKLEALGVHGNVYSMQSDLTVFKEQSVRAMSMERWLAIAIATCHTVTPHVTEAQTEYHSISPDETALVDGLRQHTAWELVSRQRNVLSVRDCSGTLVQWHVLATIDFTSKRKRMSALLQGQDGALYLVCKGADNVIKSRFRSLQEGCDVDGVQDNIGLRAVLDRQVDAFANKGLRVLVYAIKRISQHNFDAWNVEWQAACASIDNRQHRMDLVAEKMEVDLHPIGVTAVEDKLQEGVPETIRKLRQAHMSVWMLTGDKLETAVNIGRSSGLIDEHSVVAMVSDVVHDEEANVSINGTQQSLDAAVCKLETKGKGNTRTLVVDGDALLIIQADEQMSQRFLATALLANTVICSRVSPSQKADIVHMVQKQYPHDVTLAIGDGGNDCAMIQAARVGIGIAGKEGMQAARASDFSIGQFRFLQRLLLVHGHWCYQRVALFTLCTFYKCMCFYTTQLFFQYFTGFSGTSLYEQWTLSMYNTLFTFFPVMAVGIFNQGLTADALLHAPELYTLGSQGQAFNLKIFWRWQLLGLVEGFACCLIPFAFYGSSFRGDVDSPQLYALGITIYTTVVLVVTTKIGLLCYNRWTWINLTACVVTIALFFSYQVIYSYTFPSSGSALGYYVRGVFQVLGKSWMFWLVVGITVSIVLLAQIILQTIKNSFMPSKLVTYQIWEKSGVLPQATELGLREEALCLE